MPERSVVRDRTRTRCRAGSPARAGSRLSTRVATTAAGTRARGSGRRPRAETRRPRRCGLPPTGGRSHRCGCRRPRPAVRSADLDHARGSRTRVLRSLLDRTGALRRTDRAVGLCEQVVGRLARPVALEEVAQSTIVDDTLCRVDDRERAKRLGEVAGVVPGAPQFREGARHGSIQEVVDHVRFLVRRRRRHVRRRSRQAT